MDHSPKLKIARAEIEAILKKHDIAGAVVLHTPGYGETFYDLSPSYSKLIDITADAEGQLASVRLRSKLADYGGDHAAQMRDLEGTANMIAMLADLFGRRALAFLKLQDWIDKATNAVHDDGRFTADEDERRH